jgi:hypothetical protein
MLDLSTPPLDLRGQVVSGFVSHHSAPPRPDSGVDRWQENNLGIGYKTANGFMLVAYRNSEDRLSVLGGYEEDLVQARLGAVATAGVRLGVGAVLGYKAMPLAPAAYPSVFLRAGRFEVVLGHSVGFGSRYPAVTWLQARYSLK